MDENFLLTIEVLKLSPDVSVGVPAYGAVTFKHRKSGNHLVVSEAQRITLEAFRMPQTVPHMLGRAIFSRTCLELREFYELVLKAHRAGVLSSDVDEAASVVSGKPVQKWLALPWKISTGMAVLSGIAFLGAIAWKPVLVSDRVVDLAIGWLVWCASLSAGSLLAASTLRGAKGEFPRPRLGRFWALPHASIDLRDASMHALPVRAAVELSSLAPLLLAAALAVGFSQCWAALPVLGALIALNPLSGPLARWRVLSARTPNLSTDRDFLFSFNRRPRRRLRSLWRNTDKALVLGGLALALVWLGIVIQTVSRGFDVAAWDLVANRGYWKWAGLSVGGVLGAVLFGFALWAAFALTKRRGGRLLVRVSQRTRRWKAHRTGRLSQSDVLRAMLQSPLFRSVDMQKQIELARRFVVTRTKAWRVLSNSDGSNSDVGLIVRGSVAVSQRLESGKKRRLRRYAEGDVFGAHGLVDPLRPRIEVRSRTPVLALTLPSRFFQERVVQQLGAGRVHCLTHLCSFLRSLPLCQHWQLASVMRLADIATVRVYEEGEKIVLYADDPRSFYVIWEGSVRMIRQGRVVEKLQTGDSFGEAELLQNSASVADAVAADRTRCLCVSRADFIRFVTHNHRVAMSLETTSSRRLGRPIFPLQASFDVR